MYRITNGIVVVRMLMKEQGGMKKRPRLGYNLDPYHIILFVGLSGFNHCSWPAMRPHRCILFGFHTLQEPQAGVHVFLKLSEYGLTLIC